MSLREALILTDWGFFYDLNCSKPYCPPSAGFFMELLHVPLNLSLAILYIALASRGSIHGVTYGTALMRLTFFGCGLGHLGMLYSPALEIFANALAVAVGIPFVFLLVTRREMVSIRPGNE